MLRTINSIAVFTSGSGGTAKGTRWMAAPKHTRRIVSQTPGTHPYEIAARMRLSPKDEELADETRKTW